MGARGRSILARAVARLTSGLLTKHLVAALLATAVDFAVMVGLVELAGIGAEIATLAGAVLGGITNFSLQVAVICRGQMVSRSAWVRCA